MNASIPEQYTGRAIDVRATREFRNTTDAHLFYMIAKERLSNVSHWHQIAGAMSANFTLIDSDGREVVRAPQEGDHFKVDIVGPGNKAGDGYDWVRVESVEKSKEDNTEYYSFRVRPSDNPKSSSNETAHFYSDETTSTFVVRRVGDVVSAEIYDRNTKANEESETAIDSVRNTVVGTAGVLTFSKMQWQALADGLMAY